MPPRLDLAVLPGTFAMCRLCPAEPAPAWADGPGELVAATRRPEEFSIVCQRRACRLLVGVLAALAGALAAAGVNQSRPDIPIFLSRGRSVIPVVAAQPGPRK